MQDTTLKNSISKAQIQESFNKIFENPQNVACFECGKASKQWADTAHAIFLCLTCAAAYKQLKPLVTIKSIGLDLWSQQQLDMLTNGGNKRFKNHMATYDVELFSYKDKLRTKAAVYYRDLLLSELKIKEVGEAPSLLEGREFVKVDIPITEMSGGEMLDEAKIKAKWLGHKTKELGSKAVDKIHHKVTSGQLKEDIKSAGRTAQKKSKQLWGFLKGKISQISGKQKQQGKQQKKQQKNDLM